MIKICLLLPNFFVENKKDVITSPWWWWYHEKPNIEHYLEEQLGELSLKGIFEKIGREFTIYSPRSGVFTPKFINLVMR